MLTVGIIFLVRALLVALFLPFSALDKVLNFDQAEAQAAQSVPQPLAPILIGFGLGIEVLMSAAILIRGHGSSRRPGVGSLLHHYSVALEAVLDCSRFSAEGTRQPRPFLGLFEKFRPGRRLSFTHVRHRCLRRAALPCRSLGVLPSLCAADQPQTIHERETNGRPIGICGRTKTASASKGAVQWRTSN